MMQAASSTFDRWPAHLARALDPAAMAAAFAPLLVGLQIEGCSVVRIKYRAQGSTSISYRLHLLDGARGRRFEQDVSARLFSNGEAARRFARIQPGDLHASPAGPAVSHLPELDMLLHWSPNDAKLPAVAMLSEDDQLQQTCLPEVVAALTEGRGTLLEHQTTLVQHVPELRVCARVQLRVQHADGDVRLHTLYAKADRERDGAATQRQMHALWTCQAQREGRLHTPRPLLWQSQAGLHWQCAVPGRVLADVDALVEAPLAGRVGQALAALHGTQLQGLDHFAVHQLPHQLRQAAEGLQQLNTAWQLPAARAMAALQAHAQRIDALGLLDAQAPATLHGDLHPHNLLIEGEQLAFVDLDSLLSGPAAIELGGWLADALYRGLLLGVTPERLKPACQGFVGAYQQAAGTPVDAGLLAWCTAHALLAKRAGRCIANLKPGRMAVVPALLALATTLARQGHIDAAFAPLREAA